MADTKGLLKVMVALTIVVSAGIPVFSALATEGSGTETRDAVQRFTSGTTTLAGSNITVNSVEQSLGDAAQLDGSADSYVSGPTSPADDGTWTVSTWVRIDDTTGTQIVYADANRYLLYNGTAGEWVGVYYDDDSGSTWRTTTTATNESSWTHLTSSHDGAVLELFVNNTASGSVVTDSANATTTNTTGDNLAGDLDETRVFDAALSGSERQQLIDRPTAPLTTTPRQYRVMYDSFDSSPTSFPAFFIGSDATADAAGVTLIGGFAGEATQAGTDYSVSGDTIDTLSGGSLDGAPAAYVTWTAEFSGVGGSLPGLLLVFFGLFSVGYLSKEVSKRL